MKPETLQAYREQFEKLRPISESIKWAKSEYCDCSPWVNNLEVVTECNAEFKGFCLAMENIDRVVIIKEMREKIMPDKESADAWLTLQQIKANFDALIAQEKLL